MTVERASSGRLYGVGVGPGDPDLLTLKALRVLREVPVVAVPVPHEGSESQALRTVSAWLRPEQRVLRLLFPMAGDAATRERHRRAAARAVLGELELGRDVAFLTEGDPSIHSTFIHVLRNLPEDLPVEVVPGISSITAAAAQARTPLVSGDRRLAVIPATSGNLAGLRRALSEFDTVVLLKVHRTLNRVIDLLDEMGLTGRAVLVERASHPCGRVVRNLRRLRGRPVHYLSLLIVSTRPDEDGWGGLG